jgi:hypothetical protein
MCSIRGAVRVARDRRATGEPLGGAVILVVFLVSSEPARKMNLLSLLLCLFSYFMIVICCTLVFYFGKRFHGRQENNDGEPLGR